MKKWIVNKKKELLNRPIFSISDLTCYHPEKNVSHNFCIINNPDWINIVALTPEKKVILVRQHRLGVDDYTLETVAGLVDEGEDPEKAALREMMEETGYKPKKLVLLKKLAANPAIMSNYIYFYLATDCTRVAGQDLDSQEDIEVKLFSIDEVQTGIRNGSIDHTIIVAAFSLYFFSPHYDGGINIF